jgi:hypothetical protein
MDLTRDQELVQMARRLERYFAKRRALVRQAGKLEDSIRETRHHMRGLTTELPTRRKRPAGAPAKVSS